MNRVEIMGRLTKDIEIRTFKKKNKEKGYCARFSLAVPRKNNREETDFIDCVAFGKISEILKKYTEKGNRLIVCGELQINSYEDDKGNNRRSFSVNVNDFYFVDFKKNEEDEEDDEDEKPKKKSKKLKKKEVDEDEEDEEDDDLPF